MIGRIKSKRVRITLLVAACVLLLLSVLSMWIFSSLGGKLQSQKAAERFRGESEMLFAQVSCFFPVGEGIEETAVYTFRQSLDTSFMESSLEAPEGGRLYDDAYSASADIMVKGERGSANVTATGVGGNYFLFHPLYLRSGSYIRGDDLMHDKVVLDEELAWKLYGGVDLAGLTVTINNKDYIIAGVISRESDFATNKAFSADSGMYMAYDALNAISQTEISCYELVCASPISGYALGLAQTGFPKAVAVENSSRFSMDNIFKVIGQTGERTMKTTGVIYPYWENAARIVETRMGVFLSLAVIFIVFPVVYAIWMAVVSFRRLKVKIKKAVPEYLERRSERRYYKRTADKGV